jgi:hypothetical protein
MTLDGPIILCRRHARKFATTLRAYPSAPVDGARGARGTRGALPSSGTKERPAWRGVMWPPG